MNPPLNIVFMGTPGFALGVLKAIRNSPHKVAGVVSIPDKPSGRGLQVHASEVSQYAREQELPLAQPVSLKDPEFIAQLKSWKADLFVVVAFRMLPVEVWQLPHLGTFNLHASLLPQYRGAAPINWAIINGEQESGVTSFLIDHQIDTGNILFQERTPVTPEDTAGSLHNRLMEMGAALVCKTIEALASGTVTPKPQPSAGILKFAPKLNRDLCRISWEQKPLQIVNLIKGLSPYPAAFGLLQISGSEEAIPVKIVFATPLEAAHNYPLGTILSNGKTELRVACKDGYVLIEELQPAGKKRLKIKEFLAGSRNISLARFI